MKLEINVISREVVTPSSPTPPHLNKYKISFLDQLAPSFFVPIIFFYPANGSPIDNTHKSIHLKKSLSQALTVFYPLAGRLVGNSYVYCNDEGVPYIEARANCNFWDVLTDPIQEELNMLFPCDPEDWKDLCLVVQATFFSCGGLAIGLGISHKLADGCSYNMFVDSWAAFSRGESPVQSPKFESAILFPPKDSVSEIIGLGKKENIVVKRFVFSFPKIAKLRERYTKNTKDEGLIRPTRIETLSAFIWTRFLVATGAKDDPTKLHALRIYADIRTRVVPPLSEYHFGNIVVSAIVPLLEEDGSGIVKKTRDAIRNVGGYSVGEIRKRVEYLIANKDRIVTTSEREEVMFRFTSIYNFPLHKADFGWGIPVWIGGAKVPINNIVFFTNSLLGGGIEAWVNLKEEDMTKFEADKELLDYVTCRDDKKFLSKI